jgi:hypothetical protein
MWRKLYDNLPFKLLMSPSSILIDRKFTSEPFWMYMRTYSFNIIHSGSWEQVVMYKTNRVILGTVQYLAERANSVEGSRTRTRALLLAHSLMLALEELHSHQPGLRSRIDPTVWRNAGVVCGLLSVEAAEGGPRWARKITKRMGAALFPGVVLEEVALNRQMFRWWAMFVDSPVAQKHKDEIMVFLRDKINPWTMKKFSFDFLKEFEER